MPDTAIVVLHYANDDMTNRCIDSILNNTPSGSFHIIIVDNNSPKEYIRESHPDITIVRNHTHYSVPGMNRGFHYALYELPFVIKYVVNFDNDIICLPNWLPPLIKSMEENPRIGIVGGRQWNEDKTKFNSVGADFSGMTHRDEPTEDSYVVWIQGSAVMMRAEMMRMIGLHDTRYKIIYSDSDYCVHALDRGWLVKFVYDSEVIHIGNGSYGKTPVESCDEDRISFVQKWFGIKFCELMKKYPFDLSQHIPIIVGYKIDNRQTTYVVVAPKKYEDNTA